MNIAILVALSVVAVVKSRENVAKSSPPMVYPCRLSKQLTAQYINKKTSKEENQYIVTFLITKPEDSEVSVKFNSEASINLEPSLHGASVTEKDAKLMVKFFKETDSIRFRVTGRHKYIIPHITSFTVNGTEYCNKPSIGYFDYLLYENRNTVHKGRLEDNFSCGRTKIKKTKLIADEIDPESVYWPWHVIVKKLDKNAYVNICDGTLISKSWVLTAGHCVVLNDTVLKPYYLLVTLIYESFGYSVSDVVLHDDFSIKPFKNDIALLKLKSEVIFNDYIQPACLWNEKIHQKLSSEDLYGYVVGRVSEEDNSTTKLSYTIMPMVSEETCVNSNPDIYTNIIDESNFCAGLENDTTAWYGDTGGGFYVFLPDDMSVENDTGSFGTWYVRGILSQSPSTDYESSSAQQYAVFTDITKYYQWIHKYI